MIEDQFSSCCILHNTLSEHIAYLSKDYNPGEYLNSELRSNGMQVREIDLYTFGVGADEDNKVTEDDKII